MLETHLKQISLQYSFPLDLEKDGEGFYQLMIDPQTPLAIKELPKGFVCRSDVAALTTQDLEDLLALLMRANYLGQGTKGGVLALNETAQAIVFFTSMLQEYNYKEFKDKIEECVNYLNYWKTRIKEATTKR